MGSAPLIMFFERPKDSNEKEEDDGLAYEE